MLQIQISKDSQKFLSKITQKKHLLQIKDKLHQLRINPCPYDSKTLQAELNNLFRADVGEYRILYKVNLEQTILHIVLIGKRNDGEIYKKARRK